MYIYVYVYFSSHGLSFQRLDDTELRALTDF